MSTSLSTTVRTAEMQAIITALGATGSKMKFYNGTRPAGVGAVTGGNTLLATVSWTSVPMGSATGGTMDFDEASASQTSSGFTAGTPTFVDLTTSADVVVARVDLAAGAGNFQFTGSIAVGQNITLSALLFTAGNP